MISPNQYRKTYRTFRMAQKDKDLLTKVVLINSTISGLGFFKKLNILVRALFL